MSISRDRLRVSSVTFLALAVAAGAQAQSTETKSKVSARLPGVDAENVGIDPTRLAGIDDVVARAIDAREIPGAVVLIGRRGGVVFAKAYGQRSLEPEPEPMTVDTIFDLASLTKPIATATAMVVLIERGKVRLSDTLGRLLPKFNNRGKGGITIEQLLRHRSGLIADNPLDDYAQGAEKAWDNLANLGLAEATGEQFTYSDVNYIILGKIVERLSGKPLCEFAASEVFEPLGMSATRFGIETGKPEDWQNQSIAPTEKYEDAWVTGLVHDPRARALGGRAGHAGLFSTAQDLALYAQMILSGGTGLDGRRILSPLGVKLMTSPGNTPARQRRGLGWDIETPYGAPRGVLFGPTSFGHTGFTGTSIWIDPATESFVIILTNRVHPDGKAPTPAALRSAIATIAASAMVDADFAPTIPPEAGTVDPRAGARFPAGAVQAGIDVLAKRGFDELKGKRVGLVTNHTGRNAGGQSTIDVLSKAPGVKLVALLSPEHGIRGELDTQVADSRDEATGLPIHSLYGAERKPTAEQLRNVDALVYDIQDIGTRFYTYISTLGLCMEAAKERGIPFIVLDRPNPIGGTLVDGPVCDEGLESFVAYHRLPVIHGMTVGELARMFDEERKIDAELRVVPCEGWRRSMRYDETERLWVNPSPNMRSLTEAMLYPAVGLLEATNLATGRGTDTPFERVGAPWIDPQAFAHALGRLDLPGVRFVPIHFTPTERQYKGEECGGVFIQLSDRDRFDPMALTLGLALTLRRLHSDAWRTDGLLRLVVNRATVNGLEQGETAATIRALWQAELDEFRSRRAKFLLYP
jgi:uncharacterized protein YbbC (DUF1343 family)/CubicO group peptidase (beta-lactamase class C family)